MFLLTVVVISLLPAQDFGYEYAMLTEYRALGVSYNFQQFTPRSSNLLPDSQRTTFSTVLPLFEFRQNNGRLAVGYQAFTDINGKERESFSVYGESQNDFPLGQTRGTKASWFIPVLVGANYLRAEAPTNTVEDFDIGSFGIGTGLKYKHFERSFGIQAFVVGCILYASEGFSTAYGSQSSLAGEVQLILPDLIYEGIVVGYRVEYQQWNMNNNAHDYQRVYHGGFFGILF